MRMRWWAGAGALIGVLAGLVVGAPAAWLAQAVAAASHGRLQLQAASGTVCQGRARMVITGGADSAAAVALPGWLTWQIEAHGGGLTLRLHADCCIDGELPFEVTPALRSVQIQAPDAVSHWPAGLLAGLGAPWNTIGAQGALQLNTEHLSAAWSEGRWTWVGTAQLDALGMSSQLSTLRPLGSYRLRLAADPGAVAPQLRLETLEGSLQLSGTGQWSGSQWRFQGEARAEPQAEVALGNLLNILGRREGMRSVISFG